MGRPDFTGNQNISEQTLSQVDVGINANTANQLDIDVSGKDVNSSKYQSSENNISGAKEVTAGVTPTGGIDVVFKWTDGNGTVLYKETFSTSSNESYNVITKSTHLIVEIQDTSGASNSVDATVNAH